MSNTPNPQANTVEEIHNAALKAIELTNFCTLHKLYHGQAEKDCTPEERTLTQLKEKL